MQKNLSWKDAYRTMVYNLDLNLYYRAPLFLQASGSLAFLLTSENMPQPQGQAPHETQDLASIPIRIGLCKVALYPLWFETEYLR